MVRRLRSGRQRSTAVNEKLGFFVLDARRD
jgi:hypothetical protein